MSFPLARFAHLIALFSVITTFSLAENLEQATPSAEAPAQEEVSVQLIPSFPTAKPEQVITDQLGLFSDKERQDLAALLKDLPDQYNANIYLLTSPDLTKENIQQHADYAIEHWSQRPLRLVILAGANDLITIKYNSLDDSLFSGVPYNKSMLNVAQTSNAIPGTKNKLNYLLRQSSAEIRYFFNLAHKKETQSFTQLIHDYRQKKIRQYAIIAAAVLVPTLLISSYFFVKSMRRRARSRSGLVHFPEVRYRKRLGGDVCGGGQFVTKIKFK